MAKTNNYQIAGETSITTTGNIDDLDVKGYSLLRMNNASLATIRGIRAGYDGQELTIVSIGAGDVGLAHQNANSSAANRLINPYTSIDVPLAAGSGTATFRYDSTTQRWRLVDHCQGAWISVPFAAGNFAGRGAMTWTVAAGDVETLAYEIIDNTVYINVALNTTDVGGVLNNWLQIQMPFTALKTGQNIFRVLDNAVNTPAFGSMVATESLIKLLRQDFANFAASAGQTYVFGCLQIELT